MKQIRIKNAVALLLNIAVVLLVTASIGWFFTEEGLAYGAGNMGIGGSECFMFFTNDSNILAALCSLVLVFFQIKSIISGKEETPLWAVVLKFVGTTAVTLTFVVVLIFLGPIMGYKPMFEGTCLELHLICPVLAVISFCFFDRASVLAGKRIVLGIIPTLIYGTVYLINVIFTGTWDDFYHFNIGGFWYISYAVLMALTYLLAFVLCRVHNKTDKKSVKTDNP